MPYSNIDVNIDVNESQINPLFSDLEVSLFSPSSYHTATTESFEIIPSLKILQWQSTLLK